MLRFALAMAISLLLASPGLGQTRLPVVLTPDETITLRFGDGDAGPASIDRGPASWTPLELAVARQNVAGIGIDIGSSATVRNHDDLSPPGPITPGVVRLRFF